MAADQLRALGIVQRPAGPQEWAQLLISGTDGTFKAAHRWEGFCGHKGTPDEAVYDHKGKGKKLLQGKPEFNVKGMKQFPLNGGGQHSPEVACPICGQQVVARSKIDRRLPKTEA